MIKTRVHILSKSKQTGSTNAAMSGNGAVNSGEVAAASYATNADNAKEAEHAKEAALSEVAKTAKISENLTNDSPVNKRFISKQFPDTAQAVITFLKGLNIGNDYSINELGEAILKAITSANYNALEQAGFGITQTKDGKYQLNISDLNVWRKAVFNELEIRKLSYVGGNFVFSACGSKIKKVEDNGTTWRCYFYQDDGSTATTNLWDVDDQARCQIFNIKAGVYQGVANRSYWRKVVAKGDDYIDLSKTDCEQGSDAPLEGDTLVQFGNRTKTDRQNIIEILTTGDEAPAIVWYSGVNSYSLEGKSTSVISPKKVEFDTNLFRLITRSGARVPLITDRGAWLATEKYGYYDRVSDNGRLWLCIAQGKDVTSRPSHDNPDWQLQVDKGANGTSEKTYIRYSDDNGATFTKATTSRSPNVANGDNQLTYDQPYKANGIGSSVITFSDAERTELPLMTSVGYHVVSGGSNGGVLFYQDNAHRLLVGKTGTPLILSCYMRSVGGSANVLIGVENIGSTRFNSLTSQWQRFEIKVKSDDNAHALIFYADSACKFDICCIQFAQGNGVDTWQPSPKDAQLGTTTGKYIGIATWDKPYPPLNPSAYTWSAFKGEDGKDAEIYRLKASKESAKVTADGLLICDAAYTIEYVQGTSVEVITSEGAAGNKPYVSAHTDKGVNVSVTAGASNTILYKLNGYFDLSARPDNIIVELYVKVNGSAKIVDTRVIPILMEAMSYTRMVRDMRENISANGRDISTIRQTANSVSVKVNNTEARLENGEFVVKSDTTKFVDADGQKKVLIKDGKVSAELIDTKQMVAEKMRTKPDSTGLSINIFGGVFEVITKYGQRGISLEVDGNGFPHLIFYGVDGRPKYDLGGDGLARMTDGVIPERWSTIKLSQASTLNDLYPHTLHNIIYHEHTAAYNNVTGTWGANAEYNDILFTDESFSSNRIADGIYTTAFDKNIDSLRPVYSEEALVAEDGEPQTKPTNESNRIYGKRVMRYHNGKMVAYAEVLFKINGNSASYCDKKGNPIQVESLDKYPFWQLVGGGRY